MPTQSRYASHAERSAAAANLANQLYAQHTMRDLAASSVPVAPLSSTPLDGRPGRVVGANASHRPLPGGGSIWYYDEEVCQGHAGHHHFQGGGMHHQHQQQHVNVRQQHQSVGVSAGNTYNIQSVNVSLGGSQGFSGGAGGGGSGGRGGGSGGGGRGRRRPSRDRGPHGGGGGMGRSFSSPVAEGFDPNGSRGRNRSQAPGGSSRAASRASSRASSIFGSRSRAISRAPSHARGGAADAYYDHNSNHQSGHNAHDHGHERGYGYERHFSTDGSHHADGHGGNATSRLRSVLGGLTRRNGRSNLRGEGSQRGGQNGGLGPISAFEVGRHLEQQSIAQGHGPLDSMRRWERRLEDESRAGGSGAPGRSRASSVFGGASRASQMPPPSLGGRRRLEFPDFGSRTASRSRVPSQHGGTVDQGGHGADYGNTGHSRAASDIGGGSRITRTRSRAASVFSHRSGGGRSDGGASRLSRARSSASSMFGGGGSRYSRARSRAGSLSSGHSGPPSRIPSPPSMRASGASVRSDPSAAGSRYGRGSEFGRSFYEPSQEAVANRGGSEFGRSFYAPSRAPSRAPSHHRRAPSRGRSPSRSRAPSFISAFSSAPSQYTTATNGRSRSHSRAPSIARPVSIHEASTRAPSTVRAPSRSRARSVAAQPTTRGILRTFGPFSGSTTNNNNIGGRCSVSRAPSLTPSSSISNRGGSRTRDRSGSRDSYGLFQGGYENDYPASHPRTAGTRKWEEEEARGRSRASRASQPPPLSGALVRANQWAGSRLGSRFGGSVAGGSRAGSRAPIVWGRSARSMSRDSYSGGSVRQDAGGMTFREV